MIHAHENEFEMQKARREAEQSRFELERAFDHLREAVGDRAEQIEGIRHKIEERRETFTHLMDDKRQAAQSFVDRSFKDAESLLEEKTASIRETLESTRSDADQFLNDVSGSIDVFAQNVKRSFGSVLSFMDDRRAAAWITVFFAGCLFGSLVTRRNRISVGQNGRSSS